MTVTQSESESVMAVQLYQARSAGGPWRWFAVRVEHGEDRWIATCEETDGSGVAKPESPAVAPKFYGVTAVQAHRRMLDALENSYDDVTPVAAERNP